VDVAGIPCVSCDGVDGSDGVGAVSWVRFPPASATPAGPSCERRAGLPDRKPAIRFSVQFGHRDISARSRSASEAAARTHTEGDLSAAGWILSTPEGVKRFVDENRLRHARTPKRDPRERLGTDQDGPAARMSDRIGPLGPAPWMGRPGRSYVYNYNRNISTLYLVEGLK
jgi:hypothetical protein